MTASYWLEVINVSTDLVGCLAWLFWSITCLSCIKHVWLLVQSLYRYYDFSFPNLICHCALLALFCCLACNFVLHTCTALRIAQRFDRAVAMSVSKLKASQKLQMWWFWLSWLVYACWCCAELAQWARFVGTDWHCLHLEPWHYRFY